MFQIDDKEIKQYEKTLIELNRKSLPFATRNTLNQTAFKAQQIARNDIIPKKFIERNKFTKQSIQYQKSSNSLNIAQQASFVGSTAAYMEDQEFGGTKIKRGKKGVPIATRYASGEGEGSAPRMKLPRKPNRIGNIKLKTKRPKAKSKRQENFLKIKNAIETKSRYVYLDLGRSEGIFRVLGGTKRNTSNARLRMVHDLSRASVPTPKTPWMRPTIEQVGPFIPEIYSRSLQFQLNRLKK